MVRGGGASMKRESPWVKQPDKTLLCGQVAIAVITGEPLAYVIEFVGHRKAMRIKEIVRVLRLLGYKVPDTLERTNAIPAGRAIVNVRQSREHLGHWIAAVDGALYDGVFGEPDGRIEWPPGVRITSYLPLS